jgi:LPPG:FO 2-phospho-L-lactate transferase
VSALGVNARVLPMSDDPVATRIRTGDRWIGLQEFMIRLRGNAPIEAVELAGASEATPTPAVLEALADARAIIVGPSNPVISIGPILALRGMREALAAAAAPVVAVSPIVGGEVLKGPTAACLHWAGQPADAGGVVSYYDGLLDGLLSDEAVDGLPSLRAPTLMSNADQRRAVAQSALELTGSLGAAA